MFDTAYNRHSNETMTLMKHVTKYKNILQLMIDLFKKFENHGIKIARVNWILITINLSMYNFIL